MNGAPPIPGTLVDTAHTIDGETIRAFIPNAMPPDISPIVGECSFSEAQFVGLCNIAKANPSVTGQLARLATVMDASSSCAIENISNNVHDVLRAMAAGQSGNPNVSKVIACHDAILTAVQTAGRVEPGQSWAENALKAAHHTLHASDPDFQFKTAPGQYRIEQNYIGSGRRILHVPPPPLQVPGLMADLDRWMQTDRFTELPLSLQIALSHYQMETIHPFPDGNGRSGRALIAALVSRHTSAEITVPWNLSVDLEADLGDYYLTLRAPRNTGNWDLLVGYFDNWLVTQCFRHGDIINQMTRLLADWAERPGLSDTMRTTALMLIANPYICNPRLRSERNMSAKAAKTTLDALLDAGIIQPVGNEGRVKMFASPEAAVAAGIGKPRVRA